MSSAVSEVTDGTDLSDLGRALALSLLGIDESQQAAAHAMSVETPPAGTVPDEGPTVEAEQVEAEQVESEQVETEQVETPAAEAMHFDAERLPPATPPPVSATPAGGDPTAGPRSHGARTVIEWTAVVVVAVLVALLVRVFVIQSFSIPSGSMEPTLDIGDRVVVNKFSYRAHDVRRGDVVVFVRPEGMAHAADDPDDLIKRVIGLPGETVSTQDGVVYIDGRELREPYLAPATRTEGLTTPVRVPEGKVFVMGDNRSNSRDSRVIGTIDEDLIVGRAFARVWPLSRVGFL